MKPITAILIGVCVIAFTSIPVAIVDGTEPYRTTESSITDCRETPLDRPVPNVVEDPVVTGTVQQVPDNSSRIRIVFDVLEKSPEKALQINMQPGAKIVDNSGVTVEDENMSSVTLDKKHFSITYAIGSPMQGISYTSEDHWIFAPTPNFRGPDIALTPRENGFIGQNILFIGNYSLYSEEVGCQNITVIKPEHANFNVEKRLEVLTYTARALEVRQAYASVHIFASTKRPGSREGMVPEHENEIFLYGPASLNKADNLWIHEYIHTRQAHFFGTSNNLSWFAEASANYYMARFSLEFGLITPQKYDTQLAQWASYEPNTSLRNAKHEDVAYKHGAVVLAELDAQLTAKGHATMIDVFRELNKGYGPEYNYKEFESKMANKGDLNGTQLNQTRAVVWGERRPRPDSAYINTPSWIPLVIRKEIVCIKWFVFGIGCAFIIYGVCSYTTDKYGSLSDILKRK